MQLGYTTETQIGTFLSRGSVERLFHSLSSHIVVQNYLRVLDNNHKQETRDGTSCTQCVQGSSFALVE